MKGLILKDLLIERKLFLVYLATIFFFVLIFWKNQGVYAVMGILVFSSVMLTLNAQGLDERSRWDKWSQTLPLRPGSLIGGRYGFGILMSFINGILIVILFLLSGQSLMFSIKLALVIFGIILIYLAILLPIVYKFGTEKGRLIMLGLMFLPAALITWLGGRFETLHISDELIHWFSSFGLWVALILGVVFMGLSLLVSVRIVQNKDY